MEGVTPITVMTLANIISAAGDIVGAAGDAYASLSEDFGAVIQVPIALTVAGAVIGIVKGLLFYRRGRSRR